MSNSSLENNPIFKYEFPETLRFLNFDAAPQLVARVSLAPAVISPLLLTVLDTLIDVNVSVVGKVSFVILLFAAARVSSITHFDRSNEAILLSFISRYVIAVNDDKSIEFIFGASAPE